MKLFLSIGLSITAGAVIGAVVVQTLNAQAKSPIYMIAINDVANADGYFKEYVPPAIVSVKTHGGAYVAQGLATVIDGSISGRAAIVVRWDSLEQVKTWRDSPEYKAAREYGDKYAKFTIFAVDGIKQ